MTSILLPGERSFGDCWPLARQRQQLRQSFRSYESWG